MVAGIGFLAWYAYTSFKDAGLVFISMRPAGGPLFFGFTLDIWEWGR